MEPGIIGKKLTYVFDTGWEYRISYRYIIHLMQAAGLQGADARGFNWDRKRQRPE
jgi:phenolic acid decarboxylase